jgi:hypothetical protein
MSTSHDSPCIIHYHTQRVHPSKKNNQNSGTRYNCNEVENAVFAMRLVNGNFSL